MSGSKNTPSSKEKEMSDSLTTKPTNRTPLKIYEMTIDAQKVEIHYLTLEKPPYFIYNVSSSGLELLQTKGLNADDIKEQLKAHENKILNASSNDTDSNPTITNAPVSHRKKEAQSIFTAQNRYKGPPRPPLKIISNEIAEKSQKTNKLNHNIIKKMPIDAINIVDQKLPHAPPPSPVEEILEQQINNDHEEHVYPSLHRYNMFKNTGMTIGAIVVPAISLGLLVAPLLVIAPSIPAFIGMIAATMLLSALVGSITGALTAALVEKCTHSIIAPP